MGRVIYRQRGENPITSPRYCLGRCGLWKSGRLVLIGVLREGTANQMMLANGLAALCLIVVKDRMLADKMVHGPWSSAKALWMKPAL
jgi:hypothetical protein